MTVSSFDVEFGALLRLYRIARGLSTVELAERVALTDAQIVQIEQGHMRVTLLQFEEIAYALSVPAPDFLTQLQHRLTFMDDAAQTPDQACLSFLSSNRGRQIVRAMATCGQPEVLDAVCDLLLANTTRAVE